MTSVLPGPLVSTQWLAENLDNPALRVLDCSVSGELTDEFRPKSGRYRLESGRPLWVAGHIPGSTHIDLLHDLSDPDADVVFMMPQPHRFARVMEQCGVGDDTAVVLYDRDPIQEAARVWWMLRAIGFDQAAVLDGGWPQWELEGRAISVGPATYPPGKLTVRPRLDCFIQKEAVKQASSQGSHYLLHVLSEKEFIGEEDRYGRPGRIPGSLNLPFHRLLNDQSGVIVSPEETRRLIREIGVGDDQPIITYCGGGLAAAFVAFALTLADTPNVTVYDGSLLEWAADTRLPLEIG